MTRALLLLFILGASLNNLCGQVGVNARYNATQAPDWDLSGGTQITELPGSGLSYGIDYWFRLKDKRIEFTPELNYFSATVEPSGSVLLTTTLYSFFFNTNIYLLDLLNDCDCPTFSKQSGILQRGFFVQISPGLSLPQFEHDLSRINSTERNTGDLAFSVGAGLGFDIGIADLITVTPMAGLRYYPELTWANAFPESVEVESEFYDLAATESALYQFHAGLRIGLRLDAISRY